MGRSANILMTFPNWLDATFQDRDFAGVRITGGAWEQGTLDFLRDELMTTRAVTVNTAPSSTTFTVDLGITRGIKIVAIPDSNCSRAARIRVETAPASNPSFDTAQGNVTDTGFVAVWNVVYPVGTLASWHPSFADGKLTEEDRASGYRMPWFHVFDDGVLARYIRVSIDDVNNPDGFIAIPRLFVAGGWQASINVAYGRGISWEPNTTVLESLGGAKFYEENSPRRIVACSWPYLPEAEAYAFALEMQRRLQNSRQLFISIDPTTEVRRHQNSFLATIRQATPLEAAAFGFVATGFVFEEVL